MFCPECNKLAIIKAKRVCVRCKGEITNNISCICDKCSNEQRICSACLKKLSIGHGGAIKYPIRPGCRSCGKNTR